MHVRFHGTEVNSSLLSKRDGYSIGVHKVKERISKDDLNKEFDLIIIGGGINGCGIARDASERGLRVLLLEKEDFASATSSTNTRLKHGGLRYLEFLEFGLVKESLTERELLLRNANYLVKPLPICIPIFDSDKRGYWTIKAGMALYDFLSIGKSLPSHKMMSKAEFESFEPSINNDELVGAALYYDAQITYPERLCLANALMAKNNQALVINHAEVISFDRKGASITGLEFVDRLTGKKYFARGKLIINSSGPWVDSICDLASPNLEKKIGGTKGSHIVIKRFNEGPKNAIYVSAKSDGRPFFIVPWQEYYLIGTTDIHFDGDLDKLKISEDEINYLINETNRVFKHKQISRSDILFSYAGVRPLPFVGDKDPAGITRRHLIFDHKKEGFSNFISIIGGKLTTYRNLSEQAVDLAFKKLNYQFESTKTKKIPISGNLPVSEKRFIDTLSRSANQFSQESIQHFVNLYGTNSIDVLKLINSNKEREKLLSQNSLDVVGQVDHAVNNEMAFTVNDVLLRRLSVGLHEGMGTDSVESVALRLKDLLQMSAAEVSSQIDEYYSKVVNLRKV